MIVGVMTAHSMAEGVGIGVSFGAVRRSGSDRRGDRGAQHPGGARDPLVLVPRGVSVPRAARGRLLEPAAAPARGAGLPLRRGFSSLLPFGLGFAGGAMGWLALTRPDPRGDAAGDALRVAAVALPAAAGMLSSRSC